jgi:hypothetical protein
MKISELHLIDWSDLNFPFIRLRALNMGVAGRKDIVALQLSTP